MGYLPYQLLSQKFWTINVVWNDYEGYEMYSSLLPAQDEANAKEKLGELRNFRPKKTGVQFLKNRKTSGEKVCPKKTWIIHLCWVKEWHIYIYIWYIYHNYITHTFIYIYIYTLYCSSCKTNIYIYIVCSDLVSRSCNNLKQPWDHIKS